MYPYKDVLEYKFDFSSQSKVEDYITLSYETPEDLEAVDDEEHIYVHMPHIAYFNEDGLLEADSPGYGWTDVYYFADEVAPALLSIPEGYVEVTK